MIQRRLNGGSSTVRQFPHATLNWSSSGLPASVSGLRLGEGFQLHQVLKKARRLRKTHICLCEEIGEEEEDDDQLVAGKLGSSDEGVHDIGFGDDGRVQGRLGGGHIGCGTACGHESDLSNFSSPAQLTRSTASRKLRLLWSLLAFCGCFDGDASCKSD